MKSAWNVAVGALAILGCCTSGATDVAGAASAPASPEQHAVGVLTQTLVDTTRSTPAWDGQPKLPQRTLQTTIWYPAVGSPSSTAAMPGATPDRASGPFPLIVFSHGLGADPQEYSGLLSYWAAAGFVVAAPQFPLTSDHTPGGTDEADVNNQPGDVSFVITSVLKDAAGGGPLSGLVNSHDVGAAGHSNGAITTLAVAANSCCLDHRIKAAEILAGDELSFPGGHFDFAQAPPLLMVHGTADQLIPYSEAVNIFNDAYGPKGLLTIKGGSHESAAGFTPSSAPSVRQATTDFFEAYLDGNRAALQRLPKDGQAAATTMRFVPKAGSRVTITTLPPPKLHLHATVTPSSHLTNGETVKVNWSGYTAGQVVNVLECNASDEKLNSSSACSFKYGKILTPDPVGRGSLTMKVVVGPVGNGVCNTSHSGCLIVVNNASSTARSSSVRLPISFAP